MTKRIDRDLGQEIFIDEMKRAEAKGNLPPATVTPQRFSYVDEEDNVFNPGMQVVQDPSGTGKTPKQVADDLESQRKKAYLATEKAYGYGQPKDSPAWLRDGLRRIGIIGPDEEVVSAGDDSFRSIRMLNEIGQGRLKHRNPEIQRQAMALYRRYESDPSSDYFGYTVEEDLDRLKSEFPSSTDQQLMENMRKR